MIWACFEAIRLEHWIAVTEYHEILCIPKYSRVKCEAICLTVKARLKLGHAAGQ